MLTQVDVHARSAVKVCATSYLYMAAGGRCNIFISERAVCSADCHPAAMMLSGVDVTESEFIQL